MAAERETIAADRRGYKPAEGRPIWASPYYERTWPVLYFSPLRAYLLLTGGFLDVLVASGQRD